MRLHPTTVAYMHVHAIYPTRHNLEKSIRVLVENFKRAELPS